MQGRCLGAVAEKLAIAVLCAGLFGVGILGIFLIVDLTKPWGGLSAADWAWMFIAWAGDTAIVYLVVEYIDERPWRRVKNKVMTVIKGELTGVAIDIGNVVGVSTIGVTLPADANEEEEQEAFRKARLDAMKELSENPSNISAAVQQQGFLFTGGYGPLFARRAERLGEFQLRYSRFLDAKLVMLMMDLEKHLETLDSDIAIVQKGVLLGSFYQDDAYLQLRALLKVIVTAAQRGEIEIAP